MIYDINVFAYGKGRTLLGESIVHVKADSADEAVSLAKEAFKDAGDSIVVRGVNPSPVQFVSDRPGPRAEDVLEVHEPKKRGRPRG